MKNSVLLLLCLLRTEAMRLTANQQQQHPADENDGLGTMGLCTEKCKYVPAMCTGLYEETKWPVPVCQNWALSRKEDVLFYPKARGSSGNRTRIDEVVGNTRRLVQEAALRPENGPQKECGKLVEDVPRHKRPMMWPDEFEMVTKTMVRLKPETYLEWGSGFSTSFYPLLAYGASPRVWVIDSYKPWCDKVMAMPIVHCMSSHLHYECVEAKHKDGTAVEMQDLGFAVAEDAALLGHEYLTAVDRMNITALDAALVDGRYRAASALKLLNHLKPNGVLIMHDFWLRHNDYQAVLEHYNVLGHTRSLVVLQPKPREELPQGWQDRWKAFSEKQKFF